MLPQATGVRQSQDVPLFAPAMLIDGKVIIDLSSSEPLLWLKVYQENQAHAEFILSQATWVAQKGFSFGAAQPWEDADRR
jgi:hypothetical protein